MLAKQQQQQLAVTGKNVVGVVQALAQRQQRMEEVQLEFFKYQTHLNSLTQLKTENLLVAQHRLEGQIMAGRAAMASLHFQLEKEGGRIDTLQEDVASAERELGKVNSELEALQTVVGQQSKLLADQGKDLATLAHSNKQREALVEVFILLACAMVARMLPLHAMLFLVPSKTGRQSGAAVARLAAFVYCLKRVREQFATLGWTSGTHLNLLDHLVRLQQ